MSIKMIKDGLLEKDFSKIAEGYNNITGENIEIEEDWQEKTTVLDALDIVTKYITREKYNKKKEKVAEYFSKREEVELKNETDKDVGDTVFKDEINSDIVEVAKIDDKDVNIIESEKKFEDRDFGKNMRFISAEPDKNEIKENSSIMVKKQKRSGFKGSCKDCGDVIFNNSMGGLCSKCHNKIALKKRKESN